MGLTTSGRRYGAKSHEERHDARRVRLLDAALDTFGTVGYADASIGQLCAAAKVSTRNFYEHFDSREAVLIALHDELNAEALAAVITAMADIEPKELGARVRAAMAAYVSVMISDPRRARIALVESVGLGAEAEAHRQAALERFAQLIELEANRQADAGVVPRRDFRLLAAALVGAVNALINTWTSDEDWDPNEVVEIGAELIVKALGGN